MNVKNNIITIINNHLYQLISNLYKVQSFKKLKLFGLLCILLSTIKLNRNNAYRLYIKIKKFKKICWLY